MTVYAGDPRVVVLPGGLVRVYPTWPNFCEYWVGQDPWGRWTANYDDGLREGPVGHARLKDSLDEVLFALIGDPQ